MGFTGQSDVLPITRLSRQSIHDFVGHSKSPTRLSLFTVRGFRYGFGNPLSASIFSYLAKEEGADVAKFTVLEFEGRVYGVHILNAFERTAKALEDKMKGNLIKKIPYASYVQSAISGIGKLGGAVDKIRLEQKNANLNPYAPSTDTRFVGNGATQYVDYALAYWKLNPKNGPAYILQRSLGKTVRPKP